MAKNKNYDIVWLITIAAALVTVVRYSAAFISSDMGQIQGTLSEWITFAMGITGLGMGILDVFGGAYLFNGWRKTMPKTGQRWSFRFKTLTFFVFGLIISGMVILIPFTVSRITQSSVADVLGRGWGMWVWSGMVNIVPYFLVGGVFAGNKVISELEESGSSGSTSGTNGRNNGNFRNTSRNTSRSSKTGRPSVHQERVFSYMEEAFSKTGNVPTFTEVSKDLNLPQSTASRLRNEWIDEKQ